MNNIDQFNLFTGLLFAKLYDSFPNPIDINSSEFFHEVLSTEATEQDGFEYASFVINSCNWLNNNDYIKLNGQVYLSGSADYTVSLTQKGLETMKSIPSTLDSSESFGEELLKSVKTEGVSKVVELTGKLLSAGVNF